MIKLVTIFAGISLLFVGLCSTSQNVTFSTIKNLYLKEYAKFLLDENLNTFLKPCFENNCCVRDDQIWCDYYFNLVLTLNNTEGVIYDRELFNKAVSSRTLSKDKALAFCNKLSQALPKFVVKWKGNAINLSKDIAQLEFCFKFCVEMPTEDDAMMEKMCVALDQLASMIPKPSIVSPKSKQTIPIKILPTAVEIDKKFEQSLDTANNALKQLKERPHGPKSVQKIKVKENDTQESKPIANNFKSSALNSTQEQVSKTTANNATEGKSYKPKKIENSMKTNEKIDSPKINVSPPAENDPKIGEKLPNKEKPAPGADNEIEISVKQQLPQQNPEVDHKEPYNQESILNSETNPDEVDDPFGQEQQRSDQGLYSNEEENGADEFRPPKLDIKAEEKDQTNLQMKEIKDESKLKTSDIINVNYVPASDPFYEEESSNFFTYFLMGMFGSILLYVFYHNKTKFLALFLEGRRSQKGRNRRKHTAHYTKLDTNLEEAITSSASGRSTQIIY